MENDPPKLADSDKDEADIHNERNSVFQDCIYYFVFIMFGIFPIYCTNKFFNLPLDRLNFFLFATVSVSVLLLTLLLIEIHKKTIVISKDIIKNHLLQLYKTFSISDYAMLAFLICCTLSTVFSKYPKESFIGQFGRENGLLIYILYFFAYFLISRGFKYKNSIFGVLLLTGSCMFLMAILQHLGFDIFGFYQRIAANQQSSYLSTIGNINFFSSFVVLVMPISTCLYFLCKNKTLRIIYYIAMLLSFCGLIVANSDTGILGLAALFMLLLFYCWKDTGTLKRCCEIMIAFLFSVKLLNFLVALRPSQSHEFRGIYKMIVNSNWVNILLILAVCIWLFLYFILKKQISTVKLLKILKYSVFLFLCSTVTFFFLNFIWFTFIDTKTDIGELSSYLRFNYNWGSHRGEIWFAGISAFGHFNIFQKLFGYGMDMFSPIISNETLYGYRVDTAHNEFLEYLLTTGVCGLLSYLVFTFSQVIKCFKNLSQEPILFVLVASVICYLAQSVGNFATTMVTPLFIIIIAIAESINREIRKRSIKNF